jgi:hypothetical protein
MRGAEMPVHYITWEQHSDGEVEGKQRFRARYTQDLKHVIEQAEHDRDVNSRHDVRIEDAKGKVVWPKGNK